MGRISTGWIVGGLFLVMMVVVFVIDRLAVTTTTTRGETDMRELRRNEVGVNDDDDLSNCSDPSSQIDPCEYVRANCDTEAMIEYLEIYYCDDVAMPKPVLLLLFACLLLVYFYFLGTTADRFFVPALARISSRLGLPPDVAGVSLLALGNGSTDMLGAIASLKSDDMDLAVGGLTGTSIFITCLVFGVAGAVSADASVEKRSFLRDVSFLWVMVLIYVIACLDEKIVVIEPIVMLCVYFCFILYVAREAMMKNKAAAARKQSSLLANEDHPSIQEGKSDMSKSGNIDLESKNTLSPIVSNPIVNHHLHANPHAREKKATAAADDDTDTDTDSIGSYVDDDDDDDEDDNIPWAEKKWYKKILFCVKYPLDLVRLYSIPPGGKSDYDRWRCVIAPFFSILLLWLAIHGKSALSVSIFIPGFPAIVALTSIAFFVSCGVFFAIPDSGMPSSTLMNLLTALAFVTCVIWTFLVANEAIAVIQCIGLSLGISSSIMGVTVLAWGESIDDFISITSVARRGFSQMAFSAVFAGPLFNIGVGMAVSLLITSADGVFKFKLNWSSIVNFVMLLGTLSLSLFVISLNRFVFPRNYGKFLAAIYVLFIIFQVLIEADVLE
jgi:solute carrier family 24 (sodium/potassium/calcium exchanger), member 6